MREQEDERLARQFVESDQLYLTQANSHFQASSSTALGSFSKI